MKGDFSRHTFDPARGYSAVLMQQGRVQVDADWNEQQAIQGHRTERGARDLIGPSGGPKGNAGFETTAQGGNLRIGAGVYYVDGILCENLTAVLYTQQQPGLPALELPTQSGLYMAHLDVWRRHITALEDPSIRETALGGPDTAIREKTVWQVRLARVGAPDPVATCASVSLAALLPQPNGTLTARVAAASASDDPCLLPPSAGFRGLENQLYRVEVHQGGPRSSATFKWSRDNASTATRIEQFDGSTVTVSSTGRDAVSGFVGAEWGEIVDERTESRGLPGQLVRITGVDPATRRITLSAAPTPVPGSLSPKLRRWDQRGQAASLAGGVAMGSSAVALEDGLQVEFSNGTFRTGDYWLVPARTAISAETGGIEWPRDSSGNELPQTPLGVRHHYAPLALLNFDGSAFAAVAEPDCRRIFPPLTAITASDVAVDNQVCGFPDARTVQDALDALCERQDGCCAVVAVPGPGWERVFDQIAEGQDAHVCFQVGTFPLQGTATVRGKGNLLLSGCGPGTRIVASGTEAALRFEGCGTVTVRDLFAETDVAGVGGETTRSHSGTLTFIDCAAVSVEHVHLRCGSAGRVGAACLTVNNPAPSPNRDAHHGSVEIRSCELRPGRNQIGMLLVNAPRIRVENNVVRGPTGGAGATLEQLLGDRAILGSFRRALFSRAAPADPTRPPPQGPEAATVAVPNSNLRVSFQTDTALRGAWQQLFNAFPPQNAVTSTVELQRHLRALAERVLTETAVRNQIPAFRTWYEAVRANNPVTAAQGIVIAGRIALDVRVRDNTIEGVLEGIHAGFSSENAPPGTFDTAGMLTVSGNRIEAALPVGPLSEHYAIFIGNCDTLTVENNYARVTRTPRSVRRYIEGIHVHGHLGRMMIVRQNHLVGYTVGITVTPENPLIRQQSQWLVALNMTPGAQHPVQAPASVRREMNLA